jgi:outer membrane lipoprotein-sorting protein
MNPRYILIIGALITYATAAVAARQAAQPPMAEQVFKNIQVLKGIPVDEFMGTMGFFASAVGLNCTDCHVDESGGSWARYADDNALKQRTRQMIVMMNTINRTNFGGRQVVTCSTCHRGTPKPNVMPSIDALYSAPPPDEPGDPFEQAPGQPPAEQILDRYLAAIGGAERLAALRSFTGKGLYQGFDDPGKSPMEIYARAPGQRATVVHGFSGDATSVVDGRSAWIAAPPAERPVPLLTLTGQELEGVRLEAALLFPARIRDLLTKWRVGVPAVLGDREVNVVQGTAAGGAVMTLCFDAETGLLVRMVRYAASPIGRLVTRIDYGDYRDVAGVRMPFRWTVAWLSGRSTYELTDVQPNTPIADARFAQPR